MNFEEHDLIKSCGFDYVISTHTKYPSYYFRIDMLDLPGWNDKLEIRFVENKKKKQHYYMSLNGTVQCTLDFSKLKDAEELEEVIKMAKKSVRMMVNKSKTELKKSQYAASSN